MSLNKKLILCFTLVLMFLFSSMSALASTNAIKVTVTEYVSSLIAYDQLNSSDNAEGAVYLTDLIREPGENSSGTSRTGILLGDPFVYGKINISNVETLGNAVINSINLTLEDTNNLTSITLDLASAPGYLVYNLSEGETPVNKPNMSIYISELRPGDSVVFDVSIESTDLTEPLNFTTEYDSWRMMTGNATGITINATNSFLGSAEIYDLEITGVPGCYASTNPGGESCFSFSNLAGEDSGNATIKTVGSETHLLWNASADSVGTGGKLLDGETRQITLSATAPTNLTLSWDASEDWAAWLKLINMSSYFKLNGTMSGLGIDSIVGVVTDSRVAVSKDRINETGWNASMNITNDAVAPLDYELVEVSIWATKYQDFTDPKNTGTWVSNSNLIVGGSPMIPLTTINNTWDLSENLSQSSTYNYSLSFNYSMVPIVWGNAKFRILDDGTQIVRLNETESLKDGYIYIQEIYVLLGGYLLKSTKTVNPIDLSPAVNNSYLVNITLENVGNEETPEWVSMFDLIPKGFRPLINMTNVIAPLRNMTTQDILVVTDTDGAYHKLSDGPLTVRGSADSYNITGGVYDDYWGYHIDFSRLEANSDGDGIFDFAFRTSEVGIAYKMTGDDLSHVENAYLLGIDPIRLDGANPSRNVASKFLISTQTMELMILIISLVLSIVVLSLGLTYVNKKR